MMNENHLASALRTLFKSGNGLEIQLWYETYAAFRHESSRERIMKELERLNECNFELTSAYDELLDTSEPGTFTNVNSIVITTKTASSTSDDVMYEEEEKEEDVTVGRKKRPSSFRLGDLSIHSGDDDNDDDDTVGNEGDCEEEKEVAEEEENVLDVIDWEIAVEAVDTNLASPPVLGRVKTLLALSECGAATICCP